MAYGDLSDDQELSGSVGQTSASVASTVTPRDSHSGERAAASSSQGFAFLRP